MNIKKVILALLLVSSTAYAAAKIQDADIKTNAAIQLSKLAALGNNFALQSNGSGVISASSVTSTELGYLSGVTSAIQTQINAKLPSASFTSSGVVGLFTGCSGVQYLGADGACHNASTGTVTGVTATAPVVSSGGSIPDISMAASTNSVDGYLTAADHTTFAAKQAAISTSSAVANQFVTGFTAPNTFTRAQPAFTDISGTASLTTQVTGILPYANGGTNASTSWTQGSVIFAGASGFAQDNSGIFYDATNHRLGIGATTLGSPFVVQNSAGGSQINSISTAAQSATSGGFIQVAENNGSAMTSGNRLGAFAVAGNDGTSSTTGAGGMNGFATETWSSSAHGSKLSFKTVPNTTTTITERLLIDQDGSITMSKYGTGVCHFSSAGLISSSNIAASELPSPAATAIAALDIDWSLGKNIDYLYTKTLSANSTLTFSNMTAGQTMVIAITNTASNYTLTWPATAHWSGGTAPTETIGAKTDVITCKAYSSTDAYCSSVQNY